MPKRTNEFQQLIFLIRSALADGAIVTESKLLRHRLTRKLREVDICIKGDVGGYAVTISIECQKRGRLADVSWVEAMLKKHQHLPTNQLILVSYSGYSSQAVALASAEGAVALTFEEIDKTDFQALLGETSSLWVKTLTMTIEKVVVQVVPARDLDSERIRAVPEQNIYSSDGTLLGELAVLVRRIVNDSGLAVRFTEIGQQDHRWFVVRWSPARDSLFLQKESPLMLRAIEFIEMIGPCEIKVAEFGLRRGRLDDVEVVWGKSKILDKETMFVATRGGGVDRITVMVDGIAPETKSLARHDSRAADAPGIEDMTMYYLVDTNSQTHDSLGTILKRHVTLNAAVVQCEFYARCIAGASNGRSDGVTIVKSAKELNEGEAFPKGDELHVFDVEGTARSAP